MLIGKRIRLLVLGGYLGAGKTTLALNLAKTLKERYGKSTSLIMNDQGCVLVDTEYSRSAGFDTRDISGGCFCTNFNKFVSDAKMLAMSGRPDVIIAEPIGTSTNIMSSVIAPMRSLYPKEFSIVPYTVVVDCVRMLDALLDGKELATDTTDVIPLHQIRDAERIVLTKIDLVSDEEIIEVEKKIKNILPKVEIIKTSSFGLENIDYIAKLVLSDIVSTRVPVGERNERFAFEKARLGWYSGTYNIVPSDSTDMYELETGLMKSIASEYDKDSIVHVKVLIESPESAAKMSLVQNVIQIDQVYGSRYIRVPGKFILNARIVSPPKRLEETMRGLIDDIPKNYPVMLIKTGEKCFSPKPEAPSHFFLE